MNKIHDRARVVLKADLPPELRKCRDKRQYWTRKAAKRAIHKGGGIHVYKCSHCPAWHLTSSANGSRWNGKLAPKSHSPQSWAKTPPPGEKR